MKRWLKYLLILALLCVMLGIVVPLGLFAYKYKTLNDSAVQNQQLYWELNDPDRSGLKAGIISSIVVFNVVGAVLLVVQQYLWFKANKKEQYPVPLKLTKKYTIVGYLCVALIFVNLCWGITGFVAQINTNNDGKDSCLTRIWVLAGGLIFNAVLTFCIMGYSEYINLQILYNQNIQMVDEGVAKGTHDPKTRMPYDELNPKEEQTDESFEEGIIIPELDSKDSVKISDKDLVD